MAKKKPVKKLPPKSSAPKTIECDCGAVLSHAKLKAAATKDKVRLANDKEQFSSDCPLCRAKRIYVEERIKPE